MVKFSGLNNIEQGLKNLQKKSDVAVTMTAVTASQDLEKYAKEHRKWTDRTGHARQRLKGWIERKADTIRIYLGHGVDYGIWLELAHEKRFSIIAPTLQARSKKIIKMFDKLFDRM